MVVLEDPDVRYSKKSMTSLIWFSQAIWFLRTISNSTWSHGFSASIYHGITFDRLGIKKNAEGVNLRVVYGTAQDFAAEPWSHLS